LTSKLLPLRALTRRLNEDIDMRRVAIGYNGVHSLADEHQVGAIHYPGLDRISVTRIDLRRIECQRERKRNLSSCGNDLLLCDRDRGSICTTDIDKADPDHSFRWKRHTHSISDRAGHSAASCIYRRGGHRLELVDPAIQLHRQEKMSVSDHVRVYV